MRKKAYLLVNFGGPRERNEIEEFLIELLTDQEVIRTPFPAWIHRWLFTRIAKKRSKKVVEDYDLIGGSSPIFKDTEELARRVSLQLGAEVITFHRYLPKTHVAFVDKMQSLKEVDQIVVVPLFPQFSYATTGSISLWFFKQLPSSITKKMCWVRAYATHPAYIDAMQKTVRDFLKSNCLQESGVCLLFSAHGLPQQFIKTGDPYQKECESSFNAIKSYFPDAHSLISYQSQFGKQPWIQPYTSAVCQEIERHTEGRKQVVIIPLSFTSDHIETLYEVEYTYLVPIREAGLQAYRCPALNLREDWVDVVADLFAKGGGETSSQNDDLCRSRVRGRSPS